MKKTKAVDQEIVKRLRNTAEALAAMERGLEDTRLALLTVLWAVKDTLRYLQRRKA